MPTKKNKPDEPKEQSPAQKKELSYFDARMKLLGITPGNNKIALHKTELQTGKDIIQEEPIFREVEEGIKIIVYTLDRYTIRIEKNGSRMKEDFAITRLKNPIVKGNDVMKYRIPKGGGTYPFFPPSLIEKFEKKIPMKTVYITEGYFKAFKASLHGVDIIGLSSITHMKDKETGALHSDIVKLIKSGLVDRFVWLTDGDCLDITSKEITEDKDLYTRPSGFYKSITNCKTLLEDYETVEKWFMHIDIDNILQDPENKKLNRDDVKGLDDLLISFKGRENEIIEDLTSFSKGNFYFRKFNITHSTYQVHKHFHLSNVDDFFLFHTGRRADIKNKEFRFIGTRYLYNEDSGKCEVKTPGEANLYFRVGDHYYKYLDLPNQYGKTEKVFHERKKTTIVDDHGKTFPKHIPKYEAFCNVPDHSNFQQIHNSCFNVYSPIEFFPDEEECFVEDFPTIYNFILHIFGQKKVHYTNKETNEKKEYDMLDLAMDYFQILYKDPSRKLPILCLVSAENNTGKSTVANFLRLMLGANVAIVGNADLAGDFNAHWATKSVVVCDETKIDKQHVIEKIKALSTARKIYMNAKGRGQVELDCFIKFVLITNNEENFIYASENDIRYWVIKVPVLKSDNPHIMDLFVEELPAFLSYLSKRTLATEDKSRMWFHPELLKTDALRKVITFSQPTIEKEFRAFFRELFLDTGLDKILMTQEVIHKEVFKNKYEKNYLANVLKDRLKLQQLHVFEVEGVAGKEYESFEHAYEIAEVKYPDVKDFMLNGKIKRKYKVARYSYPSYQEIMKDNVKVRERVEIKEPPGRPYVILRKDFVTAEESDSVKIDPETEFTTDMVSDNSIPVVDRSNKLPFG